MRQSRVHWSAAGLAALLLASSLVLLPGSTSAQGMQVAPGVTLEVLADYGDLGIPGVSKVRLLRFTLQPGAKVENLPVKTVNLCEQAQGTLTAVTADGTTIILGPGSRHVERPGLVYKLIQNNGSEPAVDVFYEFTPR